MGLVGLAGCVRIVHAPLVCRIVQVVSQDVGRLGPRESKVVPWMLLSLVARLLIALLLILLCGGWSGMGCRGVGDIRVWSVGIWSGQFTSVVGWWSKGAINEFYLHRDFLVP